MYHISKSLRGQSLLIRDFLNAVKKSENYIAFKSAKNIGIHRKSRVKKNKKPSTPAVFTIKNISHIKNNSSAQFNKGDRKKIAFYMSDLVHEFILSPT